MNLGENIYKLRTEKNLSQGGLADALEVSRQSVSKWENNSAVPELDKLIKMAGVFGITLDELVSGNAASTPKHTPVTRPVEIPVPPQQVSGIVPGIIFLCAALLLWLLVSFLCAIPLLICGILCFCLKRRWGLWCSWTLLFFASFNIFNSTGIALQLFWVYLVQAFASITGLYQLLTTLALNVATVGLSIWTIRSYLGAAIELAIAGKSKLAIGWGLTLIPSMLISLVNSLYILHLSNSSGVRGWLTFCTFLLSWVHLAARLVMLVVTVGCIKHARKVG